MCCTVLVAKGIHLPTLSFIRVILSLLYSIVETMRVEHPDDSSHYQEMRATFATELGMPMFNNEPVAIILFNMVNKFCNGTAPHFPIKKVLLLLWKIVLVRNKTLNCLVVYLSEHLPFVILSMNLCGRRLSTRKETRIGAIDLSEISEYYFFLDMLRFKTQ